MLTAPAILLPLAFEGVSRGAAGGPVVIDFEDLRAPGFGDPGPVLSVTDQYASRGVTFNGPPALDYSIGQFPKPGFAHSGTKAVEPCYTPPAPQSPPPIGIGPAGALVAFPAQQACPTLSMTFASPQVRVKVWVGDSSSLGQAQTVVLQGFDSSGAVVATGTASIGPRDGTIPIQNPIEAVASTEKITRATVGFPPGQSDPNLAVDDVEFERGRPAATLSPGSLDFHTAQVGSNAPPDTVTLASTGTAPLAIGNVTIGGTGSGDFVKVADGCSGKTLQPTTSCAVLVQFRPTTQGARSASLSVADNASDSPQVATLRGTGTTQPTAQAFVSPNPLVFGNTQAGSAAPPGTVTVASAGTAPLAIGNVTVAGIGAGDFAKVADGCSGTTLAPNTSCFVQVRFRPSVQGGRSATLSVADNASDSPQVAALQGTGTTQPTALALVSPNLLVFSSPQGGGTDPPGTVTVTSSGTAPLTISTITVGGTNAGDFAKVADGCSGTTLRPNGSCSVQVQFHPTAQGARSATLSVADNASNSPQTLTLVSLATFAPTAPAVVTTPGSPPPSGSRSVVSPKPRVEALALSRSAFVTSIRTPRQVPTSLRAIGRSTLLALVLIVFITFTSQIFEKTFMANYDEIVGWFTSGRHVLDRILKPVSRRLGGWGGLAFLAPAAAVLYAFLDPHFNLSKAPSQALVLGIAGSLVAITLAHELSTAAYIKSRYGDIGHLRVFPASLVAAVA
ncbi:MAG TPA: choice-of-anchor D domain-containing protein, partial [Actinomycetota bacterium]